MCENLRGRAMSGTKASIVHAGAKRRKFTSDGDDWRQWVAHHDETIKMLVSVQVREGMWRVIP